MNPARPFRTIIGLCLLLAACASSPPVRYYALAAVPENSGASGGDVHVGLGPIDFPGYLDRPQIITRTSDTGIRIAEFDRWAEPLDAAFLRSLTALVDRKLDDATVVAFPYQRVIAADYHVIGRVTRFDAGPGGEVTLVVRWTVLAADDREVMAPRVDSYTVPAKAGDYAGMVASMDSAIEAFGRDLAELLESVIRSSPPP